MNELSIYLNEICKKKLLIRYFDYSLIFGLYLFFDENALTKKEYKKHTENVCDTPYTSIGPEKKLQPSASCFRQI